MTSISYGLRKADILEFNDYHAQKNSAYGKSITRHQVLWPGVTVVVALYMVLSTGEAGKGVMFLAGAFVWSLLVPAWIKKGSESILLSSYLRKI